MVNRDPAKKQQSMGQYRRGKWRFARKCSNQWVNTAHLYVPLDCRTWKVENLAFERFFLEKPCSWCIRTVTSWCRFGTFGWCKTRGDRCLVHQGPRKVAHIVGDLPSPTGGWKTVSSNYAGPKRPDTTSARYRPNAPRTGFCQKKSFKSQILDLSSSTVQGYI